MIEPPETEFAGWAHDLLHRSAGPTVIGHSERSYQFAALAAAADRTDHDAEVLYIGTVLHDIALADPDGGDDRFEARGANSVRAHLLDAGMDPVRANNVWDVIALHTTSSLAAHKSVETRLANVGISIDVRGVGHDGIPPDAVRATLERWPRATFPAEFEELLAREVRARPGTARFCFLESVAEAYVDGYQRSDFLGALRSSASFR